MRDLKAAKKSHIANNNRRKREPRDWKKIFHALLRTLVGTTSLLLIVCGGVLSAQLLFNSNYFQVDTVQVENSRRLTPDEIVALSDVRLGHNIFELDLERIGRKMEENPWIYKAKVQRLFPRTVVIRVEERVPTAVINLDYLYYVDGYGDIFKVLEAQDSLDFPVVTGLKREDFLERPEQARQRLQEVNRLIDQLGSRHTFSLADVSEFHLDAANEIVLYTIRDGVPVRMGRGDYQTKLDRLERIYGRLKPSLRALKYIDLNVMDRVIVKLETGLTRKS
ncbi:MAG: FtsQ-type POTRA domain-containing protein [Desulfuromonadaceae bacterium]|jgi:cell division protein FtsQ